MMFRLLSSTSVRIALSYAALVIITTLTLSGIIWWRTTDYLDREINAVIVADTQAVGDRLRDFGLPGAVDTINDRIKQTADQHAVYLLTDPTLTPVAGNLEAWPIQVGHSSGWYEVPLVHDGSLHETRILHVVLESGFHLLVGRDIQERTALRTLILNTLAWTVLASLILATAGSIFLRRVVHKRVETINQTALAIVQGDLGRRMSARNSADEFDQLVITINGMLDQIQKLIEGARRSSDAIAHDLRTPLAELQVRLVSIIRDRQPLDATITEVRHAVEDVDGIIEVFNALLRLGDIKSGVRRSGFRHVALADVISNIAELYAPVAADKGIGLRVHVPQDFTVNGDPHLLAQAAGNLVDNALKFTPDGGTISIQLRRVDQKHASIEIADNGAGIPDAEKCSVTNPFYRGHNSVGKVGIGLGLHLVDAVARLHNGTLTLTDNGPGLVASLVLPIANSALFGQGSQ